VSVDPPFFYYEVDPGAGAALAEVVNEGLRTMCARRPDRLWWMATVTLQHPVRAAEVLAEQRRLGCVGVEIGTSTGEARLDDPRFEPFWARAEELGLPVMPTRPTSTRTRATPASTSRTSSGTWRRRSRSSG
jgi:aminocarboxymuconate-semialdehyde decarboxylase